MAQVRRRGSELNGQLTSAIRALFDRGTRARRHRARSRPRIPHRARRRRLPRHRHQLGDPARLSAARALATARRPGRGAARAAGRFHRERTPDEARAVLRDPGRAALEPPQRARGVQERGRAGGARRAGRLPQPVDGRAPLPRGVLALLEPGDPVRAHRREDVAAAARLWRAPAAAALQPSGAHGRVGRGARPALRRPRRVRHRPLGDARRARGLRHRPEAHARDVAGGARAHRRLLDERRVLVPRHLLVDAAPARAAEAAPGSAPADLGRHDEPRGTSQRSGGSASGCARSASGCRPSRSRRRSTSTARASRSARSRSGSS